MHDAQLSSAAGAVIKARPDALARLLEKQLAHGRRSVMHGAHSPTTDAV